MHMHIAPFDPARGALAQRPLRSFFSRPLLFFSGVSYSSQIATHLDWPVTVDSATCRTPWKKVFLSSCAWHYRPLTILPFLFPFRERMTKLFFFTFSLPSAFPIPVTGIPKAIASITIIQNQKDANATPNHHRHICRPHTPTPLIMGVIEWRGVNDKAKRRGFNQKE